MSLRLSFSVEHVGGGWLLRTPRRHPCQRCCGPTLVIHANAAADPTIYKVIKREMDSAMGVISQVIVAGKASGLGRAGEQTPASSQLQYVANVGLKVNHKLGGHNMRIRGLGDSVDKAPPIWSTKPTMLIGIDVSHPQSFDTAEPSIAGIVASMDKCAPRAPRPGAPAACGGSRVYRQEVYLCFEPGWCSTPALSCQSAPVPSHLP